MAIRRIWNCILNLSAHSPVLAITDREGYLNIEVDKDFHIKDSGQKPAFSIINLSLGGYCIQMFTIYKDIKLKDFLINLRSLQRLERFNISDEKAEELRKKYLDHLKAYDTEAVECEKESLLRHLDDENQRIERAHNKTNALSSFVLMALAVIVPFITIVDLPFANTPFAILIGLEVYVLLNLTFLVFQTFKVRGCSRCSFMDLKDVPAGSKEKEYTAQIYYDWQQVKRMADLFVSYVKQFEDWLIGCLVIGFLCFIVGVTGVTGESGEKIGIDSSSTVYTLSIDEIEKPYTDSARAWYSFLSELQYNDAEEIFIMYGVETDIDEICNELLKFTGQEIKYLYDENMSSNTVKIILDR